MVIFRYRNYLHSHAISDISNLQTSLDGKLGVSDTAFAATTLTGLTSTITELNYVDIEAIASCRTLLKLLLHVEHY